MVHRRDLIVLVLLSGPLLAQSDSALFQDPRVQRILRLESKGRHQAACEAYDELAADTAFRSLALRQKGTCLALHQGRPVEAMAIYDAAIAWAPRDPANYVERAMFNQEMNMPGNAVTDMRMAISLATDPRQRSIYLSDLASAYAHMRRWKEGLDVLDTARALDSTDIGVLVNRSLALDELGRHREALAELLRADSLYPRDALIYNNLGYHYTRRDDHQGSLIWYRRAVEVQPDSPYALNNLGYAELRAGDREAALRLVQRSIEIDPGNSYAYRNLGHVWKEKGDLAKACEAYERALQLGFGMRYGPEVKQMKDTYCR